MNLKPLSNRVLVEFMKSKDEENVTKSGIVLPDSAEKKEQSKGTVTAIGPGKMTNEGNRLPMSVKVGDRVVFSKPWGDDKKFEENEKEYYLIDEDDVLAIIE